MFNLNSVELIETEVGTYPISIRRVIERGEVFYEGKVIDNSMEIYIRNTTKEGFFVEMKNSIEERIHEWIKSELSELNISLID